MSAVSREHNARAQAFYGAFWTFLGFGGSQIIRLAGNLVLAWLLFPEAFGLMALVNVFMRGLQMFSDLGVGPALIQNPRGQEQEFRRVAWTMQVIRGAALWLCACLLAWPVAYLYARGRPDAMLLLPILPIIGFTAFLGGLTSTSVYILNRRMRIGTMTMLELGSQLLAVLLMVLWALFIGKSVWALVAGGVLQSVSYLVLSHLVDRGHRERLTWNPEIARELARFGGWIFASTVVSFLVLNLDRLVLGSLLSLAELGLYSIAMTFARLGMQIATRLSNVVLFPLLAKRLHQPERMMELCLRGRHLVLLAGGSVCVAFTLLAPLFFYTFYDERYHAAGPLSRWLSIYIWAWILVATIDRVPLAIGKTRTLFVANLINVLSMALTIPGYLLFNVPGFILGLAVAQVMALLYISRRLPCAKTKVIRQSLLFTLGFALYVFLGLAVVWWMSSESQLIQWMVLGGVAFIPLALSGLLILREMRS